MYNTKDIELLARGGFRLVENKVRCSKEIDAADLAKFREDPEKYAALLRRLEIGSSRAAIWLSNLQKVDIPENGTLVLYDRKSYAEAHIDLSARRFWHDPIIAFTGTSRFIRINAGNNMDYFYPADNAKSAEDKYMAEVVAYLVDWKQSVVCATTDECMTGSTFRECVMSVVQQLGSMEKCMEWARARTQFDQFKRTQFDPLA